PAEVGGDGCDTGQLIGVRLVARLVPSLICWHGFSFLLCSLGLRRWDQRGQAADRPGGVADREDVRGQVLHDYRPGPHDGVVTDRDARTHDDAAPQPHIVADGDRLAALDPGKAAVRLDRVGWREQLHVGADLDVVAD